jgi:ABC-type multidrug transport system fused ATPase/permease subunit
MKHSPTFEPFVPSHTNRASAKSTTAASKTHTNLAPEFPYCMGTCKHTERCGLLTTSRYFIGFMGTVAPMSTVSILWFGSTLVIKHEDLTVGILTSFLLLTVSIGKSLSGISGLISNVYKALGANGKVFELIDRQVGDAFGGPVLISVATPRKRSCWQAAFARVFSLEISISTMYTSLIRQDQIPPFFVVSA